MIKVARFFYLSIVLSFVVQFLYAVEIKTPSDAVRAMGHEMSEMRHMLETYAMIGTDVTFQLPKEKLKSSIALYEEVIAAMEKTFTDDAVKKQIIIGRKGWAPVKGALVASLRANKPSPDEMKKGAIFIHGNIRKVIKAMETMKSYMLTKAQFKAINELNAVLEIDASARRLSAHYAMAMWELPDPTIEAHWKKGIKIYRDSLALLEKSSFMENKIFLEQLKIAKKELNTLTMMYRMGKNKHFVPAMIQVSADKVCDAAIKMTTIVLEQK
jgi:hypothetical protein